ncbi:inorganic pyrophosphatase [Dysgonomonas gadei]|uniref:inorganic diphosphatase n=1 Tax=Dysgonomonas gadei ATCC BAA-286 TaxID=742766 RepID=F5IY70_9BACT|nr:inorganic pyrophosphatase [Dysgonomonas gadei]EGK01656.1 inorganic diphosphatase [Dysgonomonas gadei ATCC BAA-286]
MNRQKFKAHPWHGVTIGDNAPEVVTCFIEIVPTDTVKYEVDKETGYLSIDRPQKYSNIIPALYGFIPQTYSADRVAEITNIQLNRTDIEGDNDPVDICVLTEKDITHGDIIVKARPIGGFRLLDHNKADDKLIAVLENDAIYGSFGDICDVPVMVIDRLKHYFTTYKDLPGDKSPRCILTDIYDVKTAHEVIRRSIEDYDNEYRNEK